MSHHIGKFTNVVNASMGNMWEHDWGYKLLLLVQSLSLGIFDCFYCRSKRYSRVIEQGNISKRMLLQVEDRFQHNMIISAKSYSNTERIRVEWMVPKEKSYFTWIAYDFILGTVNHVLTTDRWVNWSLRLVFFHLASCFSIFHTKCLTGLFVWEAK